MSGYWSKGKVNKDFYKCSECKKNLEKGEECYIYIDYNVHEEKTARKCVECQESKIKEEFETISSECFKKIFELGLKTNDNAEDLSVEDYKEVRKLTKELDKVERKQELDDPLIKQEIEKLKNQLKELEEHASPQTKDKASNDKKLAKKGNKKCHHENIEPYEDDPDYYCCSYCWDSESEEFLKVLTRKGLQQGVKKQNNPNHRERERERERAKLQSDINKLVNKPNKTAEEEDELAKLKTKLKELEEENKKPNNQPTNQSEQPTNYLPLIIVSVLVVVGLILILFLTTRKKKHS